MNVFKEFDEIGVQYTYPEEEWKIYKKNEIHLANIDHAIRIKIRIEDVDWISVAELMRGIDMIREKVG